MKKRKFKKPINAPIIFIPQNIDEYTFLIFEYTEAIISKRFEYS